ncbi:MAG: hypothetical protein WDN76_01845 [Alphaproteobacteria bacterium]
MPFDDLRQAHAHPIVDLADMTFVSKIIHQLRAEIERRRAAIIQQERQPQDFIEPFAGLLFQRRPLLAHLVRRLQASARGKLIEMALDDVLVFERAAARVDRDVSIFRHAPVAHLRDRREYAVEHEIGKRAALGLAPLRHALEQEARRLVHPPIRRRKRADIRRLFRAVERGHDPRQHAAARVDRQARGVFRRRRTQHFLDRVPIAIPAACVA